MLGFVESLFSPQVMLTVFAAVAGAATVVVLALPFLQRDGRGARLKAIARHRDELSQKQREAMSRERAALRGRKRIDLATRLLHKVNLQDLATSKELRARLIAAGYRSPQAPVTFLMVRVGMTLGLLALGLLYALVLVHDPLPLGHKVMIMSGAVAAGFFLPPLLVKNQAQKRQMEMTLFFPDALDLLVICTEAGLSIEASFARVTEEIGESSPILAEEMGLTSAELAFLGDRRKAYANLAERTGLQAARSLATTLIQSEKYGTPVGQALKVLAAENRQERMAKAEKKAGALPAQLTVPMIVFFLPALFLVIMGPAVIQILAL